MPVAAPRFRVGVGDESPALLASPLWRAVARLGGLVATPVIGVPTSTGYGAAAGGIVALLSMVTSCAPGVAVVNIDDGFGAAAIAARIARAAAGAA